jgi:hypothetical protein
MSHVEVGDRVVLAVQVRDGQYHLKPPHARQLSWPPSEHGLLTGDTGWIAVLTGQDWATVDVEIESLSTPPAGEPRDVWEMAVERSIAVGASPHIAISDPYGGPQHTIATPEAAYRIRVHCRNRGRPTLESYLIQVWPAAATSGEQLLAGPDALSQDLRG